MTPVLVTAPAALPVALADVKAHLRVTSAEQDAEIAALMDAATAYLDGWSGVLGRCIMEQTWAVTVDVAGTYTLPMPNVTGATVDYGDGAAAIEVTAGPGGPSVEVSDAGSVQFTCEMPEPLRAVVGTIIKLMVERDFDRPSGPEYEALTRTIDSLVGVIRWRRV